jgi:hypothetical protein
MSLKLPAPLLSLGLQLFPILVFLVVDALVQDALWAIISALVFVVVQTLLSLARGRGFDRFLLLDLVLLGGMGAASLLTKNEVFFKLKPAILEGIMIPYFLFLALGGEKTLTSYFNRYGMNQPLNPAALPLMRRLIGLMGVLVALHAGLTAVAAIYWSKRAWGLISGPGFYVLLLPLLLWMLYQRHRARRQPEPARRVVSARRRSSRGP